MPIAAYAFSISFALPALVALAAIYGGPWLAGPPIFAWVVTSLLDRLIGRNGANPDPATDVAALFWHRVVTWAWLPLQLMMIFFCLFAVANGHLSLREEIYLFLGVGIVTGGVGITYAHELIHQRNWWERRAGDLLLISVCYGHFASEHLHNHHRYVGTPKDPVTARYGESFWRFFPRAVIGSAVSAWRIDGAQLEKRGRRAFGLSDPRLAYLLGAGLFFAAAWAIAGWLGVAFFALQAFVAITQLEAVNYVEHYGLTRKHLGGGKYEHTRPHHSWNASQPVTNLLLINLQRHSDHHYKPDRRFPLLQTYSRKDAPQLPFGYPLMVFVAMTPPLWFFVMNRRVREWRERHYPEIREWALYQSGLTPMPR